MYGWYAIVRVFFIISEVKQYDVFPFENNRIHLTKDILVFVVVGAISTAASVFFYFMKVDASFVVECNLSFCFNISYS